MKWWVVMMAACSSQLELQGAPHGIAVVAERPSATLDLPPLGTAASATLSNGWPVWLVHHGDGTVTVISGVGPPRDRSAAIMFASSQALVRWFPETHRMLAGDVIYDDTGHVLGYASATCRDDCPHTAEPALEERDLDTFAATLASDQIVVGALQPAPANLTEPAWHDIDRGEHEAHDLELGLGLPAIPIMRALARPLGSYAVVRGAITRSTTTAPRLCAGGRCAPVVGIAPVRINRPALYDEPGIVLVRRDPDGFALIAMTRVSSPQ